jgi:hypothetical protein
MLLTQVFAFGMSVGMSLAMQKVAPPKHAIAPKGTEAPSVPTKSATTEKGDKVQTNQGKTQNPAPGKAQIIIEVNDL